MHIYIYLEYLSYVHIHFKFNIILSIYKFRGDHKHLRAAIHQYSAYFKIGFNKICDIITTIRNTSVPSALDISIRKIMAVYGNADGGL